jgi:hypothetical protein
MEYGDASGTALLDVRRRRWCDAAAKPSTRTCRQTADAQPERPTRRQTLRHQAKPSGSIPTWW